MDNNKYNKSSAINIPIVPNSYNLRPRRIRDEFETEVITPPIVSYTPKAPKIEPVKLTPIQKDIWIEQDKDWMNENSKNKDLFEMTGEMNGFNMSNRNTIDNDFFQLNGNSAFSLYIDKDGHEFDGYVQLDPRKTLSLIDDYDYDNNKEPELIIPWKNN